jgi:Uma2 family endonuclease
MTSTTLLEPAPTVAPSVPEADVLYEIIDGQIVEIPPRSAYAAIIGSLLVSYLNNFARAHHLGVAVSEVLFHLDLPVDRNRRPDGAFVSFKRWPRNQPLPEKENAWNVVPDLAIEVISPSDFADELLEKVVEYFQAGVQLVWLVYPRQRTVHVYESFTQIRALTRTDELEGSTVLPDFRLPLTELFPEPPASA